MVGEFMRKVCGAGWGSHGEAMLGGMLGNSCGRHVYNRV